MENLPVLSRGWERRKKLLEDSDQMDLHQASMARHAHHLGHTIHRTLTPLTGSGFQEKFLLVDFHQILMKVGDD